MLDAAPRLVRFGAYELDAASFELRRHGRPVRLAPQACRLLVALTASPNVVVSRAELRRLLWADDVHVEFERSLNAAMRKLRVALRDDADRPRYVETVPGRGYRFIAPLAHVTPSMPPPANGLEAAEPAMASRAGAWRGGVAAAVLICVGVALAVAAVAFVMRTATRTSPRMLLVVRAGDVRAGDRGDDVTTAPLLEALRAHVGRLDPTRLAIVDDQTRASHELVVSVGRHTDVSHASVRLIDRRTDEQLWGTVAAAVPDRLGRDVLMTTGRAIVDRLLDGDAEARVVASTLNDRALDVYREARAITGERMDDFSRAIEVFERAVQHDPAFAPAWAGLARARASRAMFDGRGAPELARARDEARHALDEDPRLADAQLALGLVRFALDDDPAGAETDLRRAYALGPSAGRDRLWLVWVLNASGRNADALSVLDDVMAHEPGNPSLHARRGLLLHALRRYEEEIAELQRAVSTAQGAWEPTLQLGLAYSRRRQYDLALPALRTAVDLSGSSGLCLSWLGRIAADAGDIATARDVLQQLREGEPIRQLAPSLAASVAHHIAAAGADGQR